VSPTKPSVAVLVSGLLAILGSAFANLDSGFLGPHGVLWRHRIARPSGNPFPINPSGPPVDPGAVKAVVLLVYGIPVLISIWWLVLFNLKGTKAQFAGTSSETSPGIPSAPACPLPVQIIAVFFLFSVLWMLVIPFLQMPFPAVFFGHPFCGTSGKVLIVLAGLLLGAGSIGLLKLKKWSYPLVLGIQGFWLLSGTITIFSPTFPGLMQEMLSQMHLPENAVFPYSMRQLQLFWSLGLLFSTLIIAILLFYRRRFMEAASAREALPPAYPRFPSSRNAMRTCARFVIRDTGPSIPAASVCYPVEAGSLRSGIRSPHG
jgi:hypothetical protein